MRSAIGSFVKNHGFGGWRSKDRAKTVIRQTGSAYCFDAVVHMLCAHFGLPMSTGAEIRRLAGTSAQGTSLSGAIHCLERIGFFVQAGRCSFDQLRKLESPSVAIIHRTDGSLHYVLVNPAKLNQIEVLDPSKNSKEFWSRDKFEEVWTKTILLASPKPEAAFEPAVSSGHRQALRSMFVQYRQSILFAVVSLLIQTALVIAGLLILRDFLKGISDRNEHFHIWGVWVGFVVCAVFKTLFHNGFERVKYSIQRRVALVLELQATEHIQKLDASVLEKSDVAELVKQSSDDPYRIAIYFVSLVDAMAQFIVAIALVATVGWLDCYGTIFVLAIGSSLIIPLFSFYPSRELARLERLTREQRDRKQKMLTETVKGIRPLRRMGAAAERLQDVRGVQLDVCRSVDTYQRFKLQTQLQGLILGGAVASAILWVNLNSGRDPGLVISLFILINMITLTGRKIAFGTAKWPELKFRIRRFNDLLSENSQANDSHYSVSNFICHQVRFDVVCANNSERDQTTEASLSFTLKRGENAILVDKQGKSNRDVAQWLTRQDEPQTGEVFVNNINIKDIPKNLFRKYCGFLPADPYIFQSSLRSNIAPSNRNLTIERLNEAATMTGLEELLNKLPDRYDTVIGRNAIFTNWEERFRIGLARIAIMNPQIIVLELPNYKLPEKLEQTLNQLVQNYWRNKIVILLSSNPQPGVHFAKEYQL